MFFILIIIMFVYVGAEIPFSELFYVFFFFNFRVSILFLGSIRSSNF